VRLFGDLPFVAGLDSPEVWVRPGEYQLDVSAGVPPDAFSPTGQDWGLPTYRWDVIRQGDYAWLRQRARRMAALFDGLRVDHTIGLYRTYGRPRAGEPFFTPADEPAQIAQGEQIMRILLGSGLDLVAEDLGSVPDFLRDSLAVLGVPGCKVLRWERRWQESSAPFIDPATFDPLSAAMTGTHDTEPLSVWWAELTADDRAAALDLPFFRATGVSGGQTPWTPWLRDRLVELAYRAGSADLFLPLQDICGWPDRINVPGTVGPHNWTWSLPWAVDETGRIPEAVERAAFLDAVARATHRGRGTDGGGSPWLPASPARIRRPCSVTLRQQTEDRAPVSTPPYLIREYPLQQGALEIGYIEEYFNEFETRKSAAEIIQRLDGREFQILMAEAPLPDDPSTVVPVSYKVSHELRAEEADPKLADLVDRLRDTLDFSDQRILYNWLGATRMDWRGQGHFRALTEEQEVWAVTNGYGEIVVKTKNRYYDMRGTLDSLQFNVVKLEPAADALESKVYLSKRLGPYVLDAHRSRRQVIRA
jgi:hypothetical protein